MATNLREAQGLFVAAKKDLAFNKIKGVEVVLEEMADDLKNSN